jgi:hypothetical protein
MIFSFASEQLSNRVKLTKIGKKLEQPCLEAPKKGHFPTGLTLKPQISKKSLKQCIYFCK